MTVVQARGLGLLLVTALAAGLGVTALPMHPVLIVATALVLCVVTWTLTDLTAQASRAGWKTVPGWVPRSNKGRDYRLTHLTRLLGAHDLSEAHRALATVVARTLSARYAVSLSDSPREARRILGDELYLFVTDPPLSSPIRYHRGLPRALDRIEEL